jgi:hypothetical protein
MRHLLAFLAASLWLSSATALADTCGERHESCIESCTIDHGMEADRKALNRCLVVCDEQRGDCRDLRGPTRGRPREAAPEERAYGTRPPGTQPDQEQGLVEPRESPSWEPAETDGAGEERRAKQADDAWLSLPEDGKEKQKDEWGDDRSETATEPERAQAKDDRRDEPSESWPSTDREQLPEPVEPEASSQQPPAQPADEPAPVGDSDWSDFGNE